VTEGVKMLKMFFVEETSIASITDLNSIFKKWEPRLILIKAVDTAHLNSCRPTGNTYYNTTISLITQSLKGGYRHVRQYGFWRFMIN
jgi:hypothetical protein